MSNYSAKERLIAGLLSRTPGIKNLIKKTYLYTNYYIYRQNYDFKYHNATIRLHTIPEEKLKEESFFGYYDKSPLNDRGQVLFCLTDHPTKRKPSATHPISLCVKDMSTQSLCKVTAVDAYNWQQGCRAQWLTNDRFIYNVYDGAQKAYRSCVYDLSRRSVVRTFPLPVQDAFRDEFFLSLNYSRIMRLRPDYGYRNIPPLDTTQMGDMDNDGIFKTDIRTGESRLLISLREIAEISPKKEFINAMHKVNHIMISPDGSKFIFIHRWYVGKKRHDRLMLLSPGGKLSCIADENIVSHMAWVDNDELFGYLKHDGICGFFFIDLNTLRFSPCQALNALHNGDGHPTVCGNWIAVDTYPDRSGYQHLYLYNRKNQDVQQLIELKHSPQYYGESRCDLHPRFSTDGKYIFFDSVFKGLRRLCYIDVSKITNC